LTDISFAIFDELVPTDQLKTLTLTDVIRYRKESEQYREEFLDHISVLQAKQASIGVNCDYVGTITKLIDFDIRPAARTFNNKLASIDKTLFCSVAKSAITGAGTYAIAQSLLHLFGDLSWRNLLYFAGPPAAIMANACIDYLRERDAAKRECSLSYILNLNQ
jgi:hypothetical protein